ncbi:SigE family RNA polymerase sigma factor [Nocardioides caeni]|uniref:SigE family RNA polymerase sigma factor n=1 Tax=Nocardioides caeni TaxID=574700 RepID=A0A4S8NL41_9ACTN|nr:SigE family RNA polymerase sigma factor [Nocardioides caeni]THV15899.1 SigE family RNA polymerase sigma factor [Nocardioides caeni]
MANPDTPRPAWHSFEDYVTARWAALFRTAHLLCGEAGAAEDLLQTTLVKVMTQWRRVERADSPDAYIRKMLLNELLGERRKGARRGARQHLLPVPTLTVDPSAASADRLDLWEQVQQLPPRQRAVLVLRYYEDLSEAEIASALGISAGTVKSQASAALRALRASQPQPTEEVS